MKPLYLYFCTVSFVSQYFTTRNYYFNHLREWKRYPNTKAVLKSPDVIWNLRGLQYREETRSAAALWSLKMRENKNKPLRARTATKLRELRQRRRRMATRTAKRQTGWIKKKLCTCITLFCTCLCLCRRCTTTTWNCLISRFVESVKHKTKIFYFCKLRYSPLECNYRKIHQRNWQIERHGIRAMNFETAWIHRRHRCLSSLITRVNISAKDKDSLELTVKSQAVSSRPFSVSR